MAERRPAGNSRGKKGNKKKKNVIIWGIILAVLIGAVIFTTSGYHEQIKQKLINSQYPLSYSEYVEKSAKKYHVDPALVYAVIRTESNFNPNAQSAAGAHGLMQITDDTFEHYRNLRDETETYTMDALYDPEVNIDYGCHILRDHLDTFQDERCAVAAYNAGPGNVEAWLENPSISPDGKTLDADSIPFEETRNYVYRVEEAKEKYAELYEH